ncbi:hypothetical protein [Stutzerimonas nitrititolerans]|uniref:hypothetical protein n=1 Tax=Stutzerimonas nitrititolerans TaxID=2482751 RepID=UPI001BDDC526|nr:hypothetical protein [Stutzerimonas nitrititolerans]MBT1120753.1 hypothetical protein [Stutzerimonas nitrititolerans]
MSDDDLSGSDNIPAENERVPMVPPGKADDKSAAQQTWEDKLIAEAEQRIFRRAAVFWCVLGATSLLFFLFLAHMVWLHTGSGKEIDHMLLWLLAVLPIALMALMVKMAAEPDKPDSTILWPEQLVRLGDKFIDTAAELIRKKLG